MSEWKSVNQELPMKDGYYEVTNKPNESVIGIMWYDGHGFMHENIYRIPQFWKDHFPKPKRYGKINDNDTPKDQETSEST